jgi:hypothetical protein
MARMKDLQTVLIQRQQNCTWDASESILIDNTAEEVPPSKSLIDEMALHITGLLPTIDQSVWSEELLFNNSADVCDFPLRNDLEEILETWNKRMDDLRDTIKKKEIGLMKSAWQRQYSEDPKNTFNRLTKDYSPRCEIPPDQLHLFFEDRWKKGNPIDQTISNNQFRLQFPMSDQMRKDLEKELYNREMMKEVIRKRSVLSAPGHDKIINPIFKIEREAACGMLISYFRTVLDSGICTEDWKNARTILLYKSGSKNDPANWRPITITNVIYRIIFCRIAQSIHKIHEKNNIPICDPDQKGFVLKCACCMEHTTIVNKKPMYILSLDLRDAFGSIHHDLIESNLNQMRFSAPCQSNFRFIPRSKYFHTNQ